MSMTVLAADLVEPIASTGRLVVAALVAIAVIVALILWAKLNAFISLTIGALLVSIIAGADLGTAVESFTTGVGNTIAGVGLLIAFGAAFGKILVDSGGADKVVDTIISKSSTAFLPWAMGIIGAIIGLPMFFEIGLVLLMPVIMLVARRSGLGLIRIGIPALAGLSAMHGLVPPHPGPLIGIDTLGANLGITMGLGILIAIPTIAIAGPMFAKLAAKWVELPTPTLFEGEREKVEDARRQDPRPQDARHRDADRADPADRADLEHADREAGDSGTEQTTVGKSVSTRSKPSPSFGMTITAIMVPVVLMLGKALVEIFVTSAQSQGTWWYKTIEFVGTPLIALLLTVIVSFFLLGTPAGMGRKELADSVASSLPPIAGIILIVGAGGGFKQSLVDTGIGTVIAKFVADSSFSPILIAWFVAVLIRLATGSATVATITASAIMLPIVETLTESGDMSTAMLALIVLAIGSGSVFFSHVNDAGFWLIKEYFGMSVGETVKTWSIMETVLSIVGLVFCLIVGIFV